MSSLEHVGHAEVSNHTASSSATVTRPAQATAGRLLVAFAAIIGQPDITAPDGWIALGVQDDGDNLRTAAWWRVAGDAEPASYAWSFSSARKNFVTVDVYFGQHVSAIEDVASQAGESGTSHPTPEVQVRAGGWLYTAAAARHQGDPERTWGSNVADNPRYNAGSDQESPAQNITGGVWDSGAIVTAGDYDRALTTSGAVSLVALWSISLRAATADEALVPWQVGINAGLSEEGPPPPPPGLQNNAEGGTDGVTVTTVDTASGDPWDDVAVGTNGVVVWDDSTAAHGDMSIRTGTGGSNVQASHYWDLPGAVTEDYARWYQRVSAHGVRVFLRHMDGSSQVTRIGMDSGGFLTIRNADGNSLVATGEVEIPVDQWVRIEAHLVAHSTTGRCEVRLWLSPDDTGPPDETLIADNTDFGSQVTVLRWSAGANAVNAVICWQDDWAAGRDDDWWGPAE